MTTQLHPVERLYNDYIEAMDAAARNPVNAGPSTPWASNTTSARVLDVERQLCAELDRARGSVRVRNMLFTLCVAIIGPERFEYFTLKIFEERREIDRGFSFPRRSTDVDPPIPTAAKKAPGSSIRRFINDKAGSFAVEFAILMPVLLIALGGLVCIAQKQALLRNTQFTIQAAATAGQSQLQSLVAANAPLFLAGWQYSVSTSVNGNTMSATLNSTEPSLFPMFGDYQTATATVTVSTAAPPPVTQ